MLWFYFFIFCLFMILLSWIDIKTLLLPDLLTLSLLWLGLLLNSFGIFIKTSDAIFGAAIGYLIFFGLSRSYFYLRKKEGLGLGDAKLLAAIGAWLGWQILPNVILIAALLNLSWALLLFLYKRKNISQHYFPFGPALALSATAEMAIKVLTIK